LLTYPSSVVDHVFITSHMTTENSSQPLGITWNSRLLTRQSISGASLC